MYYVLCIVVTTIALFLPTRGISQTAANPSDPVKVYYIELNDGTKLIGNILYRDSIRIEMKTTLIAKLDVLVANIKKIEEIDESTLKNGVRWFPNPHSSRYLFSPSALNLKKGEGYYQNTMLALNSFNVGITDNISIGGGLELISTVSSITSGEFQPILFITPKVSYEVTEDFHAGAGLYYVNTPNIDLGTRNGSGLAIAYGIGTYGSKDHNLTGGLGWGFVQGQFEQKPIITVSGMTRISEKTALITENWFISNDNYYSVFSYGVRFFGDNLAVDLAFVNNKDIAEVFIIGFPWVSFVVKF